VSPNESVLPLSRNTIQALEGDAWFGEPEEAHSNAVSEILHALRLDEASVLAARHLHRTLGKEALVKQLGQDAATLLIGYRGLRQAQAKLMKHDGQSRVAGQEEILRKMLLAFGNDLRVVLIYLASRLQTLRWIAKQRFSVKPSWAQEILDMRASRIV
jgi:GTP pyrophosphokinase